MSEREDEIARGITRATADKEAVNATGAVVFVLVWLAVATVGFYMAVRLDLPAWQGGLGPILAATIVAGIVTGRAERGVRRQRGMEELP